MAAGADDLPNDSAQGSPEFAGLQGVEELVNSRGLAILREGGHVDQLRAVLQLMRVLESEDAARKDAA